MIPTESWVETELASLKLSDQRLKERAIKIVSDLSHNPSGSIPEFSGDWKGARGVYNFCANQNVDRTQIVQAHQAGTVQRIKEGGYERILALQDTTEFNYQSHGATEELGPLDHPAVQGFFAHNVLAASVDGLPLGLLAQQVWVRQESALSPREKKQLPIAEKESYKWLQGLSDSTPALPAQVEVIVVSDRESDIFEYFVHPRPEQVELLVRATHNRRLADEQQGLWATLRTSAVRGKIEVEVRQTPTRRARTASCQVYYKKVKLKPPKKRPGLPAGLQPIWLSAILVREMSPPEDEEPVEWLLLTTLAVSSFAQACDIVAYYAKRWLVERFHFVLKSGCALEDRQLRTGTRLQRFLALANLVAWRLLWLTYLGRGRPDLPCTVAFEAYEWQALYAFVHQTPLWPEQPPSLAQATLWLAQLGGFLGRKSDGSPGVQVLWRGWSRLVDIVHTWLLFNPPLLA